MLLKITKSSHANICNMILWGITCIFQTTTKKVSQKSDIGSQRNFANFVMSGLIEAAGFFHLFLYWICCDMLLCPEYMKKTGLTYRKREDILRGPAKAHTQNCCYLCSRHCTTADRTVAPALHELTVESGGPRVGRWELPALPAAIRGPSSIENAK